MEFTSACVVGPGRVGSALAARLSESLPTRLTGRELKTMSDGSLVIQRGRPPGLREVRVRFRTSGRDRGARLQLVQIHDGDGYTSDRDIERAERKRAREDRTDDYYEGEREDYRYDPRY